MKYCETLVRALDNATHSRFHKAETYVYVIYVIMSRTALLYTLRNKT